MGGNWFEPQKNSPSSSEFTYSEWQLELVAGPQFPQTTNNTNKHKTTMAVAWNFGVGRLGRSEVGAGTEGPGQTCLVLLALARVPLVLLLVS